MSPGKDPPAGAGDDELFRVAVDLSPTGLLAVDRQGIIVLANREVERLFGWSRQELVGKPIDVIVRARSDAGRPGWLREAFEAPAATPLGAVRELQGRRKDGTEAPIEIGLQPVRLSRGPLVLASVMDVTARKRADERFQAAVESAPSGMLMVDSEGNIVLVNREAERLFGWSRDEIIGKPIEMLVPARFRGPHPRQRAAFLTAPSARAMGAGRDLFGLRKDGTEIPVEIGLNPLRTEDGVFVLSSVVDITARREAEARLRESEERFRLLVDGVHDYAVLMLDPSGHVASWNVGAERTLGYRAEEMLGRHLSAYFLDPAGADASSREPARRAGRTRRGRACARTGPG
jgi:PAS domain S-box-containing protein